MKGNVVPTKLLDYLQKEIAAGLAVFIFFGVL
jgi:hypothetical protein